MAAWRFKLVAAAAAGPLRLQQLWSYLQEAASRLAFCCCCLNSTRYLMQNQIRNSLLRQKSSSKLLFVISHWSFYVILNILVNVILQFRACSWSTAAMELRAAAAAATAGPVTTRIICCCRRPPNYLGGMWPELSVLSWVPTTSKYLWRPPSSSSSTWNTHGFSTSGSIEISSV